MFTVDMTYITDLNENEICPAPMSVGVLDYDHLNSEKYISSS